MFVEVMADCVDIRVARRGRWSDSAGKSVLLDQSFLKDSEAVHRLRNICEN